jgi:HD-like signal output (HDOD) protein
VNPKLERIVARIHEVPSLPSVLTDVLSTIDSPESTIDEIAREIKKDQSLTVNVLKIPIQPSTDCWGQYPPYGRPLSLSA